MGFINYALLKQSEDLQDLIKQYGKVLKDLYHAADNADEQLMHNVFKNGLLRLDENVRNHKDYEALLFPVPKGLSDYYRCISQILDILGDKDGSDIMIDYIDMVIKPAEAIAEIMNIALL